MLFTEDVRARFDATIDKTGDCWLWTGSMALDGYGRIGINVDGRPKRFQAHRVAFEMFVCEIADGLVVMHLCDVQLCVNPAHLVLGTRAANNFDCRRKGRAASASPAGQGGTPPPAPNGAANPKCKLRDVDVVEIRDAASKGEASVSLAKRFGVSTSTVLNIVCSRTWRHLLSVAS
jgi:hypothetical protein